MSTSKLIMVVDDKEVIRDVLCFFLENKGYETVALSDGLSAVSYAQKRKPDLVLLDIKMPGLDGIDTCYRLRQILQSSPSTGIIILTGHNTPRNVGKAFVSGAIDVIKKPFDLDDVNNRINIWFEVRNIESEIVRLLVYSAKVNWQLNKGVKR